MKSLATERFWKLYDSLPREMQQNADRAYLVWRDSPFHPSLQFKRVHQTDPIYSVRVGRGYRALGRLEGETMIWYWIGNHDDYLRQLK